MKSLHLSLHAIHWRLNDKVWVGSLRLISLRSAMDALKLNASGLEGALSLNALGTLSVNALDASLDGALGALNALDLGSATGGSRDHWSRVCHHSRSFSSSGCIWICNITHFSGRHLKAKGNRRSSFLSFGVVEGDGITLGVMESLVMESLGGLESLDWRSFDLESWI